MRLARRIIEEHWDLLEKRKYAEIAGKFRLDVKPVQKAVDLIMELDPKPGLRYAADETRWAVPDVVVEKLKNGEYAVTVNDDGVPRIRMSGYYSDLYQKLSKDSEEKKYMDGKFRSALWLIKSIDQRNRTLQRTVEEIVSEQRDFFDKGIMYFKPLTLKEISDKISVHESTVSRVTVNKYVDTPRGIFPLRYFFDSKVEGEGGGSVSSNVVKENIRSLVEEEKPAKPLTDSDLAGALAENGIKVARRTVSKYREGMKILPASMRRK